ncbi:acyl-CoA synthetase [Sphingobium jiangsuense]|uniref:3-methylmercaptopropionyl-CoA ligase n=1 Tax=Sphingobium jiangsuense TaxID=870476 RepID=A0A7W6FQD6_9SPHN|nr:fatty acid--CoA ligase [Sphingobium jiangsuense]MBB3926820.1 long-chain acyl-CoA synthetase [Sphingobium jiangsuense]GLS98828.1 acyl-CoA synthetase [Sphingobium jiangsuense]
MESSTNGLAERIRDHARTRPDAIALIFEGRETGYGAFDRNASRVANALIAAGCRPGDRVAYLGKNRDIYFEYWIGAVKAGLVTVPVNWRLAPPEVAYILNDCRPRVILCEPEFLDRVTGIDALILVTDPAGDHPVFTPWRDAQPDADPHRDAGYDGAVLQLYTSGTTGNPKGAMLSNRSLLGVRASVPAEELPEWYRWSAEDVSLIAMPVFHISGSGWGVWTLQHGARGIVVREFDPERVLDLLVAHHITKIMLVPTALRILCDHPAAAETDFSFLKTICYGGSAIPLDLLRQAIAVIGCGFAQMYGMTETAGTIVGLPPEDHDPEGSPRMRGIGIPLPGVRVRIVDAEGRDLPAGEVGEIVVASQANMIGYFDRPEATAETVDAEGWLRTGDAGWMDADGYLYLADRIKDMIITGGENVYPAEVENALYSHPDVADVAVIGVPDPKWGEAVKAIVVPAAGASPDPAALIAWARERIAAYKAPKTVDFRADLPRNPSGKVLRRLLREDYG